MELRGCRGIQVGRAEELWKLDVNFNGTEVVKNYALRPCVGRSVSIIMPLKKLQIRERMYNQFNGVEQPAIRDSGELLGVKGNNSADENVSLPLLDFTGFRMIHVSIRHILDYV